MNKKLFKFLSISALLTSMAVSAVGAMDLNESNDELSTAEKSQINIDKDTERKLSPVIELLRKYCEEKNIKEKFDILSSDLKEAYKSKCSSRIFIKNYFHLTNFIEEYKDEIKNSEYSDVLELLKGLCINNNKNNNKNDDKNDDKNYNIEKFLDNVNKVCKEEGMHTPKKKNLTGKKRRIKREYGCEDYSNPNKSDVFNGKRNLMKAFNEAS